VEFLSGLDDKFGTMFKTMCLLFEGITGGNDWGELAKELKIIGNVYYTIFALYIVFVTLGVLNIVTGFFVEGTMEASANQKDVLLKAAQNRKNTLVNMLGALFEQLDTDMSETISLEELESHLFDEALEDYFCVLGLQPEEALDLFLMLDMNNTGHVGIREFTKGCLKILETPKSFDILSCSLQSKRIVALLEDMATQIRHPNFVE